MKSRSGRRFPRDSHRDAYRRKEPPACRIFSIPGIEVSAKSKLETRRRQPGAKNDGAKNDAIRFGLAASAFTTRLDVPD
jgi:hypothetical protein